MCLEDYPIHTVTGLVKQWLRELPDPLMTFMHYNDFLHAIGERSFSHKGAAFYFSSVGVSASLLTDIKSNDGISYFPADFDEF